MSEYLDGVNKTKVTAKLLAEALTAYAAMPSEDRPVLEARAFRLFELLKGKGFGDKKRANLSIAIEFRLEALAHLRDAPAYRGWMMPSAESGADSIHYDLLRVAAVVPLVENGGTKVAFDPNAFRERLLKISSPRGEA